MAVLGLHCRTHAVSSCGQQGLLPSCSAQASHCSGFSLVAALRLLTAVASLVVERELECWLSSWGTQA